MMGTRPRNGLGEDALTLQQRRHRRDGRATDRLPLALIVDKEERAVGANRAPDHATKLIAAKERLGRIRRCEKVPRIQRLVPEKLEDTTAHDVGAGLRGQVHHAAIETSELGRRAVRFDLEFLDRVDVGKERHLARLGLEHRDAVEQIFVGARPAAVDAGKRRARRQRDPRREPGQRDEAAAIQRQVYNLSVIYDLTEPGAAAAEERRVGVDRDRIGEPADLESNVQPHRVPRRHVQAVARQRAEPVECDRHAVRAWGERHNREATVVAGDDRSRRPGRDRGDGHHSAGQDRAVLVGHRPDQATGSQLCVCRRCPGGERE